LLEKEWWSRGGRTPDLSNAIRAEYARRLWLYRERGDIRQFPLLNEGINQEQGLKLGMFWLYPAG